MDLKKIVKITNYNNRIERLVKRNRKQYKKERKRFHMEAKRDVLNQAKKGLNIAEAEPVLDGLTDTQRSLLIAREILYWKNKGFEAKIGNRYNRVYIIIRWDV